MTLASDFIASVELPSLLRAAAMRGCRIVLVIVGPCGFLRIEKLKAFQALNSPGRSLGRMRRNDAEEVLAKVASIVTDCLFEEGRAETAGSGREPDNLPATARLSADSRVDRLITGVRLADWPAAEQAALKVVAQTDREGGNEVFEALLNYQDCPSEDERLWGALHTIECCVRLAPWLITHSRLSRMANHKDFSVRSSAASICMDLAHSAPDRVPLDIVLKLSVYNEDWYVQTPANAAIKAMARAMPEVLRIFHVRLRSSNFEESIHSAEAIRSVAEIEPGAPRS